MLCNRKHASSFLPELDMVQTETAGVPHWGLVMERVPWELVDTGTKLHSAHLLSWLLAPLPGQAISCNENTEET